MKQQFPKLDLSDTRFIDHYSGYDIYESLGRNDQFWAIGSKGIPWIFNLKDGKLSYNGDCARAQYVVFEYFSDPSISPNAR